MSQIANASVTSLNFIGFEDVNGQGMPQILYNQVFIEPNQSFTAGVGQIAAAGFVPGTQSYLKRRQAVWSSAHPEGFTETFSTPMTQKQQLAKYQSESGAGMSSDLAWGQARPRPDTQGDMSAYTHSDNYVARGFFP